MANDQDLVVRGLGNRVARGGAAMRCDPLQCRRLSTVSNMLNQRRAGTCRRDGGGRVQGRKCRRDRRQALAFDYDIRKGSCDDTRRASRKKSRQQSCRRRHFSQPHLGSPTAVSSAPAWLHSCSHWVRISTLVKRVHELTCCQS